MASLFITFEGQEGAGKTTQIKLLYDYLLAKDADVILTREPGNDPVAEILRAVLKDPANAAMAKEGEVFLFAAARAIMVAGVIEPHLNKGGIVLCDRFVDSTTAYQGFGNKLDLGFINSINQVASRGIMPNITFLLQIDPSAGLARKAAYKQLDRIESRDISYHTAVKEGYDYLAAQHPNRIVTIDAALPPKTIHGMITERVDKLLEQS
ncbi:MAG: dTMP kinase [Defluviitaleaceae bacterium]|nr:dTMP kinase [Defluviitaleaceae bacterium]